MRKVGHEMREGDWTDDMLARVKKLLDDGQSCGTIARAINAEFKVRKSRNAVIGVIARRGLREGSAPVVVRQRVVRRVRAKPVRLPKEVAPPPPVDEPEPIGPSSAFAPSGTCQLIHGHPAIGPWRCCGHPVKPGSLYCPHHHARSYVPQPKRGVPADYYRSRFG